VSHTIFDRLIQPDRKAWGRGGLALASYAPEPTTCVVFVHGWSGNARTTWDEFPSRMRLAAPKTDFFFYDYDSIRRTVAYSAGEFRLFLDAVLSRPCADVLEPTARHFGVGAPSRPKDFAYNKVVLCCHSLGAVVARRALLDLEKLTPGQVAARDVRMLMFAPAHRGSHLAELARDVYSFPGISLIPAVGAKLASVKLKSVRGLEPGSGTLRDLDTDNAAIAARIFKATRARPSFLPAVWHGEWDAVVEQEDFPGDDPFHPVAGTNHRNICKPTHAYPLPADELLRCIQ
jgi:pimeloyl-ACP methyl ester carboxylesterase